MKYRAPDTREFKDITVKTSDTLPIGTIVDYDGTEVPSGWENVENYGIKKVEDREFLILSDGFSIENNGLYRKDNHVFGYITIAKNSKFTGIQENVGSFINSPLHQINMFGVSGTSKNDTYDIPSHLAYVFIGLNDLAIKANSSDEYIKFYVDYITEWY